MPNQHEPRKFVHGSKLANKAAKDPLLSDAYDIYKLWKEKSLNITGRSEKDIRKLVVLLNKYKDKVEPIFDKRANSAQEVLQPSILEEFFEILFCKIENELGVDVLREPASGFIGLVFNPKALGSLLNAPEYTIRRKDHDFVIGAEIELSISTQGATDVKRDTVVVPAIAIECKRYLERNMLDECAGTAEKIKKATPYCKYYVVAEFLKMDDASPEISLIDEIYVLRRQRNLERLHDGFEANPISADLVNDLYRDCIQHLKRIWWNPQSALTTGKVFSRP